MVNIKARNRVVAISAPLNSINLRKLRDIPAKKSWQGNIVLMEPTAPGLDYLRQEFPDATWDEGALKWCQAADTLRAQSVKWDREPIQDYLYKTKPYDHQEKIFKESRDKFAWALIMEQGTGKTKVTLDTAAYLYALGKIRGLLIIAKNGVHANWIVEEIPLHLPDYCKPLMACWDSRKGEKKIDYIFKADSTKHGLVVFAINVEALSTAKGYKLCERFLLAYPSMGVIDESTSIKTPGAKRTKNVLKLASFVQYRRILTGTPVTKGPLDVYTQYNFLDEEILGYSSFYTYKAHFAVLKDLPGKEYRGRPIKIVVAYQNLPELQELIKPHSSRVLKKDCLDLPEKIYQTVPFEMSDEQWHHYNEMEEEICTEFQGRRIAAPLAMTKMLRLHQIACGFLPSIEKDSSGEAICKKNPRLECAMDILENIEGKVILFGIYRFSLREIYNALREAYGDESVVAYAGNVSMDDRAKALKRFQDPDSKTRYFVGQTHAAGYGLTLTQGRNVLYYCNDNNLEVRLQSEDRPHRIGQLFNVLYSDIEAARTVDVDIIENLVGKKVIADQITGDQASWRERGIADLAERERSFYAKFVEKYGGKFNP
jgi:SNF2 family DNA or RNA helicase